MLKAQVGRLGVPVYFLNYSQYFFVFNGFCCNVLAPHRLTVETKERHTAVTSLLALNKNFGLKVP